MARRFNGGVRGKLPTVTTSSASGMWDLLSAHAEKGASNWPSLAPPSLYAFTAHTFTNATATGINGPTLAQCQTAYSGAAFLSSHFSVSNGTQQWTCPATGTYRIDCIGANGGSSIGPAAGRGASVITNVTLTEGTVYNIIVGQCGHSAGGGSGGHGGGGSWVFTGNVGSGSLIVCAGGGGGTGHDLGFGGNGSSTSTPTEGGGRGNGGYIGLGQGGRYSSNDGAQGTWNGPAGGGAGWLSDGTDARADGTMGSYTNIGYKGTRSGVSIFGGGRNGQTTSECGGFGGGAGGGGNGLSGGGGGGYTGGGGGMNWPGAGNPGHGGGQGGGSFWTGSLVSVTAGGNASGSVSSLSGFSSANGSVTITRL